MKFDKSVTFNKIWFPDSDFLFVISFLIKLGTKGNLHLKFEKDPSSICQEIVVTNNHC